MMFSEVDKMTGRIGLKLNGYEVTVEHLPGLRKKPCLMVRTPDEPTAAYKVASFNSEKTADWFLSHMEKMFGAVKNV